MQAFLGQVRNRVIILGNATQFAPDFWINFRSRASARF
jgi:hypothetical protein